MAMADGSDILDIAEAAEFLNVSETSLRRWTNSGKLPCLRIGQKRERRFRRSDLLSFMEIQHGDGVAAPRRVDMRAISSAPTSIPLPNESARHLCALYSSDDGRLSLAVPFLLAGLREGSLCFLVAGPAARRAILKHMTERRRSVGTEVERGHLLVSNYHKSPHKQWEYFDTQMSLAARNKFRSFRVFGDVWELRKRNNPAAVIEYEDAYEQLIARRHPVLTLCVYDARRFDGVGVLNALRGHPDTVHEPRERVFA
jgi:transcriptional repressor of dcmA and dcmR